METIGDAYMVVGGLPMPQEDHAERTADMSIAMVIKAMEVSSPATGKPLQVRYSPHYPSPLGLGKRGHPYLAKN